MADAIKIKDPPKEVPKGFEDIRVNLAPKNLSDEEIEALLRQDVRVDFHKIARVLEEFHGLFAQMWDMGYPQLTWDIPTAAVQFSKDYSRVDFLFNPIAWQKLDYYTKAFVIGHECLHAILNHGMRGKDCPLPPLANRAMDIVVNHMLVAKFGFSRAGINLAPLAEGMLDDEGKQISTVNERGEDIFLCWIDTVFGSRAGDIKRNKPFEYYYAALEDTIQFSKDGKGNIRLRIKGAGGGGGGEENSGGNVLDDHDRLDDFDDEEVQENIAEKLNEQLTEEEKKDFSDRVLKSEDGKAAEKAAQEKEKDKKEDKEKGGDTGGKKAGTLAGRLVYRPTARNVMVKRKWETVIRKWARKHLNEDATAEQWARKSRRMVSIDNDLIIPHDMSTEERDIQRVDVAFFLDVSGSCYHLKDRFFKAAASLPKDRFNMKLYCFDTEVHEVDIKNPELKGGGGTAFDVLEQSIQDAVKSGGMTRYPDAVFLITDGYGNAVHPEKPANWYWFLSHDYREYIPKESKIFLLDDFE